MTNQQGAPEALRLADAIDPFARQSAPDHLTSKVAADELRRLHAENERLSGLCDKWNSECDEFREDNKRLAALVEAQQPAPSAAAPVVVVKAMGYGGSTGINDYLMSDGTVKAMRPAEVKWAPQPSPTPQADSAPSAAAPVGEAPLPLLVRDIAADLGTTPIQVCTALAQLGFGGHSVNMAVTPRMAQSLRAHFASPTPQADSAHVAAPADTVVLDAALRAIHQAIDLIGEPNTERLRTVRRVLRGAVVVAEDGTAPQADSQPAPVGNTGHDEADQIINRLMSSDPDFEDCMRAAMLIQREIKGPDGYPTWRDAAVAARAQADSVTAPAGGAVGIYVASRASLPERPAYWRALRAAGWPIVSTWIDEAGPGETADLRELWARIIREISSARGLVLHVETDDFPLKGALIEVGAALSLGKRVGVYAPGVVLEDHSMRPLGSWAAHPLVRLCTTLADAREWAESMLTPPAQAADSVLEDAARWRAFIGSARIRFFGWAGADLEGNKEEKNVYGEPNGNYVHFGAEFWTIHDAKTERPDVAARLLTTYADAARKQGANHD